MPPRHGVAVDQTADPRSSQTSRPCGVRVFRVFRGSKKKQRVKAQHDGRQRGFTLLELTISVATAMVIVLSTGALLNMGRRMSQEAMAQLTSKLEREATRVSNVLWRIGRQSNRSSYVLYTVDSGVFTQALPVAGPSDQVVAADALELRYWDVPLDEGDSHDLLDTSKFATAYVLFYVEGGDLKADYGAFPPGGVIAGARNTADVSTVTLATAVQADPNAPGLFSHYVLGTTGHACTRLNVVLTDPTDNNRTYHLSTAVLLRNIWPR